MIIETSIPMKIQGIENIKKYIPQREPIIMVDSIVEVNETSGITGLTVNTDNIFVENNILSESGIVEHIAQSAAAGIGYRFIEQNQPVPIGFIAAVKNLKILSFPKVGDQLTTEIQITNQVLNITIINAKVSVMNSTIAECEMRIFLNE